MAAGTYTVTVVDDVNCSQTVSGNVTQPALLEAATAVDNVSCNGVDNGVVELTVTGGTTPYDFDWDNGATTEDLNNVEPGSYTVLLTDANGCTADAFANVTEPDTLGASSIDVQVSCNEGNNGSIDLTPIGGLGPYLYSWNTGATTQDINGLSAGTYTVTFADQNGCLFVYETTISEPDLLVPTCTSEDALCNGDANGEVSVSVAGGTAPYSYSWSNGSTDASQTGLVAGTYVVTVTDENGCTATCTSVVGEPNSLTAVVVVQDETLVNGCNGSATANPTGGTPPYSYEWSTSTGSAQANGATTQTITDLCAGTYEVIVTDANDCEFTTSNIVNPPSCDLDVDVTATDVSCNDGSDGTATATPITIQNNTPFTYVWNNSGTTQTINGITAGPYSVVVTDSIGCEASGSVVVSEPTALSVSTVVVDEQNFGACDGSATANPTGGTPPYSYSWNDSQNQDTQTASDLCPGTYEVTVTDANGCEETVTITVNPLLCTGFTVAINTERLSCFEAGDGSATAIVTGGTAPFTYSWSNNGTTDVITGLDAGQYTVTVVDAVGCTQTVSGNVTQPALLEAATAVDNVSCHGTANGVVELTVTGGTNPYTFDWDNSATTEDLNNVGPGSYNVLVTDENGCTTTASAVVTEPDTLQVSSVDVNPTCFEGNDGSIDLTVSGGLGPYLVAWDNQLNTADISGLSAGTYTATIVDQNGCIYIYSTTLSEPNLVVPTVTADGPIVFCEGDSVTLTASTSASYSWSPNGETTQSITVYDAGDYSVSVVTEDGCEGTSASTTVTMFQVEPATITIVGSLEFCQGERVELIASEGDSYLWSTTETSQTIFINSAGTYSVIVTDENGCESASDSVDVIVNPLPQVDITADGQTEFCQGGSVTLTATESESYFWTPNGETTQSITVTESGDYGVSITDENGCSNESQFVTVTVYDLPQVDITANGPTEFCEGDSVTLTATSADAYQWLPNGEITQAITVSESGSYSVTVTDGNGCMATSALTVVNVLESDTASITVTGVTELCEGEEVTLTSSLGDFYLWSPNGETTQSVVVTESGDYSVSVINQSGCTELSDTVEVVVNPLPQPVITADGPTEFCKNDSVTLTATTADSYLWSPNGETTQSITVYESDIYSVTVTDQNGCEGEATSGVEVTVFEIEPASVSANGPLEFCDGDEVVLTASVGDLYVWYPNGEVDQAITVTESGQYVVTVTDANGCEAASDTVDVTVYDLPEPVVSASGPTTFCEGDSVILTVTQSDAYLWSPDGQITQAITVYEEGSYVVEVTDANGCSASSTATVVTVYEATEIEITASGATEFCADDEVVLTATAGQSYVWSPNGEQTQFITVNESGEYIVSVTDANGCSYDSDTLDVEVFELPTVSIDVTGDLIFCEGETVDLTAVTPNVVTYEWLENGSTISGADSEILAVGDSSLYTVIVTDVNGCTATDDAPIMTVGEVPVAVVSEDQWMCVEGDVTLLASGGQNYLWSNGSTDASITVSPDSAMYFTVSVTNEFCSFVSSDSALVSLYPSPIAEILTNPNGILEVNHDFTDVSGDSSIVYWAWDYGDGEFEELQNPDHLYSSEGFFTVILTVENEFGCVDTDTAEVEVTQVIDIPNVFTPNNDGINDFIFIDNFGVDQYEFTVYNRWGLVMHHDSSGEISWNGRTPAGHEAEAGTYYYTLDVLNPHSEGNFQRKGTITLIR